MKSMCKQKLLLINAPIDVKYKDSTSLFCPPLGLLSIKTFVEKNNNDIDIVLLDGMILTQQDILEQVLCKGLIDKVGYEKEYDNFFGCCDCRSFYLRMLLQR